MPKDERMMKAGTPEQTELINDYPTHHTEDKLKVPYIERYNGNICVKNQNFEGAISHYNKALLSLKMLFQGNEGTGDMYVTDRDQAVKMLIDIETPAYLNLAHCYIKTEGYHFAIKYANLALENDPESSKAYYRRGVAYTKIGEVDKARESLNTALGLKIDEGERATIGRALNDIKMKEKRDRDSEKEMSKRMIKVKEPKPVLAADPKNAAAPSSIKTEALQCESHLEQQVQQRRGIVHQLFSLLQTLIAIALWMPTNVYKAVRFMIGKYFSFVFLVVSKLTTKGWKFFVAVSSYMSKLAGNIPVIGKFFSWLFLIPSRIRMPNLPMLNMLLSLL